MASEVLRVEPADAHNEALVGYVHPPNWANPEPEKRYNMVVIGAGTAGLVTAAGAAGLGAKVALVERHLMGGDCLNFGCVPSKALIRSARAVADVRAAAAFGVPASAPSVDFAAVMEQMRALRAGIAKHDSAERFRSLGIDVFLGDAKFTGPRTIEVGGASLNFSKACIATGARASAPPIPGIDEIDYLTNETLFSLTELPRRMAVIGAGPIGAEMAQTFARLGSEVTLVERESGVLPREDPDAGKVVRAALERDGVRILCACEETVLGAAGDEKRVTLRSGGASTELLVDAVLVAVGRAPNVASLALDAAGIAFDMRKGVTVDDALRTSNKRVYAAGDVASRFQFTHTADAHARIVIRNALFPFLPTKAKTSKLVVPWCTYTEPEVAHVGLTPAMAAEQGIEIDTIREDLSGVDRAILDRETEGFVKVHVRKGKDEIVGATLVSRHAGETIGELTVAMANGVGLGGLASVIHPYPTQAEVVKRAADAFNRTKLTPRVAGIFKWLMARQR